MVIGAVRAAFVGSFVPVETEPFEGVFDEGGGTFDIASLVGIFDAEDEFAVFASLFGDKIGVDGGTDVADMDIAGGAGGETSDNFFHEEIIAFLERKRKDEKKML